ncbi:hypothetical protein OG21DRAFT_782224 [Imleria badia]|nr:hypothetical protein OG21DRAFT_782224 [Imleria badia]
MISDSTHSPTIRDHDERRGAASILMPDVRSWVLARRHTPHNRVRAERSPRPCRPSRAPRRGRSVCQGDVEDEGGQGVAVVGSSTDYDSARSASHCVVRPNAVLLFSHFFHPLGNIELVSDAPHLRLYYDKVCPWNLMEVTGTNSLTFRTHRMRARYTYFPTVGSPHPSTFVPFPIVALY